MLTELAGRALPVLGFLLSITVVADLTDRAGLFDVIARTAARRARHRVGRVWLLLVVLTTVVVAVLSLDTAAVLLTPILIGLARRLRLRPVLFAWTTVWLANTASLFLPVSNLTNLIAMGRLDLGTAAFARLLVAPAIVSVVLTTVWLWVFFRRDLRPAAGAAETDLEPATVPSRPLLLCAAVVCIALVPALALGVNVTVAAAVAALLLALAALRWLPGALTPRMVPWPLILGVAVLFTLVTLAHEAGLTTALLHAAGTGEGWPALLRLAAFGALGANVINNLPAYLVLEPAAHGPLRTAALLVGVNTGPLISPWASLATLLWAQRCRAAGLQIHWGGFALRGLVVVASVLPACVASLLLVRLWP